MWKEKIYTGTLSSYSATATVTKFPDSTTVTVNTYKTDKLNDCIKNFLTECGVSDVTYYPIANSTNVKKGNLYIYGVPFQFYVSGSNTYFTATSGSTYTIISGSSSTTVVFDSSGNYSIRICLAGNPASSFGFSVGATSYGGTSYSMAYLMIYKAKDVVNNQDWVFTQLLNASTSALWLTKTDGTRPYNVALTTSLQDNSNYNIIVGLMNLFPNKYPLIPKYYGMFKLVDCYEVVSYTSLGITNTISTPASSSFVMIGNKTYFYTSSNHHILIDCG